MPSSREDIDREIRAYAERWSGTDVDLDPALEAAGIKHWLAMDPIDPDAPGE